MHSKNSDLKYFFGLDAFRGIGSLIVVTIHWKFFYFQNDLVMPTAETEKSMPFFNYLGLFYTHAAFVVDMFFLLSGFVFFWLYADKIGEKRISVRKFFTLRFTRIYPVHLFTLLLIGALQYIFISQTGHSFASINNDGKHFFLNLLLIQSWCFDPTPAQSGFNAPAWSVSVESFLYILFFIVAILRLHRNKVVLFAIVFAGIAIQVLHPMIGQGIFSFFIGGLIYYLYHWIANHPRFDIICNVIFTVTALIWIMSVGEFYLSFIRFEFMTLTAKYLPGKADQMEKIFNLGRNTFFRLFTSPLTILTLALLETRYGSLKAKWAIVLGHSSYSIYLLHYPLMVAAVVITNVFGIGREFFHSPIVFIGFFLILLILSIGLHYSFEYPVQELVRKKMLGKSTKTPAVPNPAI